MTPESLPASLPLRPIGVFRSPFADKFGTPRQPGLAPAVRGEIHLHPWVGGPEAVRGLEGFSHIWVLFWFHHARDRKVVVRPPRLGGKEKVGIFASRSPHRPNPIGLSVLSLEEIRTEKGVVLRVGGVDIVDGSPVLDIKPYLPYADALPGAQSGWAAAPIPRLPVHFSEEAELFLAPLPELRESLLQLLSLDPRPNSHHHRTSPAYVMHHGGVEVWWRLEEGAVWVERLGGAP
ncbi:MAG TPA: tRNA (N6-threonylcarbamoyladenosine(37)-N6)-methyltransferase TrmO [Myxococcota bacterium]|nr:tRNA (N6-threonylcarbamoyladenosine(37)-N6)-methyltransferase TrmO [Myxococcota bacterium]HNH48002.1 tRNA (N6-threonylcarbamoyladenosine(37)-N6)-methyltransferase TrmO [Myxococcota bacterium]